MDIFEWSKMYPNTNYYDLHTKYFYHIQAYDRAKKKGIPVTGISVSLNGVYIGMVKENKYH